MAHDVFFGCKTGRDWSIGTSDLPAIAKGYAPETFWGPAQMEAKLAEIMAKPTGFLVKTKPSRKEAIVTLADFMKSKRIGPMNVSGGIGAEVGSLLLPAGQQKALFNKIDDVRYDVRGAKNIVGAAMFAVAGGLAFLGIASIYRSSKRHR